MQTLVVVVSGILALAAAATVEVTTPCVPNSDYLVKTEHGHVRGCQMKSIGGRNIAAFRGIRYAKPPVGKLRFADPQPPDTWPGIVNAYHNGPACIQKNYLFYETTVQGQEDCLFLNVFTNKLPSANETVRRPVMVYIHGGGFFTGTGSSYWLGSEYLLDRDIVLVTFNYRLAVFGFLSTQDDNAVGNWGMKDQLLVLKWVQKNIEKFGGDKNSVTIFGQSAGSASVHFLVLSQRAKGLFHKALSQSGSALNVWAVQQTPLLISQFQASFVGCPLNNTEVLVACLRNVDAKKLVESADKFKFWDIDPLTVFVPSIEKRTTKNPMPFIDELPKKIIKSGKFNKVPYMMGIQKNEGLLRVAPIVSRPFLRKDLNKRWDTLGPQLFGLELSVEAEDVPKLWDDLNKFYLKHGEFINESNPDNIQDFVDMYGDRSFIYDIYRSALEHAKYGPIYFYNIEYKGKYTFAPLFIAGNYSINYTFTASHCDELIYLFRGPALLSKPLTGTDSDFSKVLVKMWTDFAREGAPLGTFWKPLINKKNTYGEQGGYENEISSKVFRHLNMAGPIKNDKGKPQVLLSMKEEFLPERMEFWDKQDLRENR